MNSYDEINEPVYEEGVHVCTVCGCVAERLFRGVCSGCCDPIEKGGGD